MSRARAKDPLTAGITSILAPYLRSRGFGKLGTRTFGRLLNGEFLQILVLDKYLYGSRSYSTHYNVIPLFCPCEQLYMAPPGGQLRDHSAANHDAADRGLHALTDEIESVAIPFFDAASDTASLTSCLEQCQYSPIGPVLWLLACTYARADRIAEIETTLKKMQIEVTNPHLVGESFVRLRTEVKSGSHQELLDQWRADSFASLKLNDKLP